MPSNNPILNDQDRRAPQDRIEPQESGQIPSRLIRNELDLGRIEPFNVIDDCEKDGFLVANQGRDTRHLLRRNGVVRNCLLLPHEPLRQQSSDF